MEIVVDTEHNITQLFRMINEKLKENDCLADCFVEDYLVISFNNIKIKKIIARCIAVFILNEFEKEISWSIIKPFEILKKDAEQVIKILDEDTELKEKRLRLIENEIFSYMTSKHINIDGVVKFRLSDYKNELNFTIELLIDEIMNNNSYNEFINMMKYFTEIQTPVTDTVVLSENNGEYVLSDINGNPINLRFDEEFADEIAPFNLSGEDLLISNLMAAMPGKIIFKNLNTNKPIINTICRIFEGRITN